MPPRKRSVEPAPENAFETAYANVQQFEASGTVENEPYFTLVSSLEHTGLQNVGKGEVKTTRFATVMHTVYRNVMELEVVPPLDEDQRQLVAGKIATYNAMSVVSVPKAEGDDNPTDTAKTSTDKAKP